jgi:acetolactate synthase-1/3 small subunit
MMKKHVKTALVETQPGVQARIVDLISGRGFNIVSLFVAPTQEPTVSRMTIQVPGDDRVLEQVRKQVNKLVDVVKVSDLTQEKFIDRELLLVKVAAPAGKRVEIKQLAEMLGAKIVSVQTKSLILEMTATQEQVDEFIALLKPFSIADISRSGVIAVAKGKDDANSEAIKRSVEGGRVRKS